MKDRVDVSGQEYVWALVENLLWILREHPDQCDSLKEMDETTGGLNRYLNDARDEQEDEEETP